MPALSHVQDCPLDHARSWDRVRLAGWAVCGTGIGYGWAVCGTETGNGSTAHVENLDIRTEMSKIYTLMGMIFPLFSSFFVFFLLRTRVCPVLNGSVLRFFFLSGLCDAD